MPTDFYSTTTKYLRIQFALIVLFWTCLWAVKAAFLAFYKTLFDNGFLGWQKVAWWIVVVFTFLSYVVNWPLQFLACQPFMSYFVIGELLLGSKAFANRYTMLTNFLKVIVKHQRIFRYRMAAFICQRLSTYSVMY